MHTYFIGGYLKEFEEKPEIEFRVEDRTLPHHRTKYKATDFRVVLYVNGEWENEWDNWWSAKQAKAINKRQ